LSTETESDKSTGTKYGEKFGRTKKRTTGKQPRVFLLKSLKVVYYFLILKERSVALDQPKQR
jgi:hypothetical protein